MFRSMFTVGGFTLMSRVLGFLRDILIARFLGTTVQSDAFFAAFRLPNMFRRIFGEGAFNSAFVPLFGRALEEQGKKEAELFASRAFTWLALILGIGTLIAIPLMRWIMAVFVFGFLTPEGWEFSWQWLGEMIRYPHGSEKFEITVAYGRVVFSYLMCMALAAHLSGVLNTLRVFAMPAFAPVLLNLIFLTGLTIGIPVLGYEGDLVACGNLLAWCVFIAGFVQLAVLYVTCRMKGLRIQLMRPVRSPRVRRLFVLMIPGIVAASIQQVNLFIGTLIASMQDMAVSYLYYSDRIYQLPLGMIGIAFGVVLLPEITRRLRSGNEEGAQASLRRGIELSMLLTLPAAIAMLAIPGPLISVLFERGDGFTSTSTTAVAMALAGFSLGLPGYVLIKVLQPGYFAREDTKSPMVMAGITVAVNIVASLALFPKFGHVGIAIATSISAWVNVLLLWRGLRGFLKVGSEAWSRLARTLFASVLMGLAVWALSRSDFIADMLATDGELMRASALAILIAVGGVTYIALALGLKATSLSDLKSSFKK
jgi:putative peptidoglycan lipid II flippase